MMFRIALLIYLLLVSANFSHADEANQKALTEALAKFTLPEMPDELKQKLRDYVPNDLKRRRDEGNARSTAEWEKIKTREEWEAFRTAKVKLLRESLGLSFRKDDWKPPQLVGNVETTGTIKGEGYRIDKLLYRSSYGLWISANLYVPDPPGTPGKEPREKMPGFIISHAHHTPKEQGELQDMGTLWARAGCYVLVPDHLGHGERRQHPFKSKDDYDKPFQVSRQDYYFRYDVNLQLNLVGESLMGCLASDLMTGVSLLHGLKGIDKEKIILLGAVAGGGDPCAVTAAIDERITCAAPFNFGGPQPETRYPLPEGVDFNYGGSGGWESTRNLAYSYRDGTLPWAIVGSIAPRRLVYAHEFAWDREHDPVWKRLEKIYAWYDKPAHLSFTHGHGTLTSKDPPGSHCTHIGKTHRKQMHVALAKWFDIKLPAGEEMPERRDASELRCWTDEAKSKLENAPLLSPLRTHWKELKDNSTDAELMGRRRLVPIWQSEPTDLGPTTARQFILEAKGRVIPLLLMEAKSAAAKKNKEAVLVICRAGKQSFVRERARQIAQLLNNEVSIALPDFYSTGLTGSIDFSRRSGATGRASTLAMFGAHLSNEHSQDCDDVLSWLDREQGWNSSLRIAVWCDSLIPQRPWSAARTLPRDDDSLLPRGPDPLPELVARKFIFPAYVRGGLGPWHSVIEAQQVLLPQDAMPLPGTSQVASRWRERDKDEEALRVRRDETVDALNRPVPAEMGDPQTAAAWIVEQIKGK